MTKLLPLLGQLNPQMFGEGTVGGGLLALAPMMQQFGKKQQPVNFLQSRQDIGFNAPRGGLLDPSLFNQFGRY